MAYFLHHCEPCQTGQCAQHIKRDPSGQVCWCRFLALHPKPRPLSLAAKKRRDKRELATV